ncbi:MAG: Maf family protein, partial [Verrucomicrobiae bacterium]|nr:Maf family protein [Verrucomicrobiae bacterium]
MKEQPTLILASSSPRRQELLKRAGIAFETINSEVAEHAGDQLTGTELAGENAYRKARSVAERFPHRIVLGADTVVCLGTKKFGKPADLNEAVWMLEQLQGCLLYTSDAAD